MATTGGQLRILYITPYYSPAWAYGGSTRIVYELATRLAARGYPVTVCTTDALDASARAPAGWCEIEGVSVCRSRNLGNLLAWKRLFLPSGFGRDVAHLLPNIDVAHIHEVRSLLNALSLPALLRYRVPYIVTSHGGLPVRLGRTVYKRLYDMLVGHRLLSYAARLHALTDMERQQYLDFGLPAERIELIPNGIDVAAFDFDTDVSAFRRRFAIPDGQPVVGFLGRLNHIKGLDFLLDAFADVLSQRPDAILLIAGPDDGAQAALEAQAERLGIRQSVRFVGMISDTGAKAAVYRMSDVYVLPSRYENLPTTVLEALLNATPCIVTDRCGMSAQLAGAGAACVVPFGDVDKLAGAILWTIDSPQQARRQAEHGRQYVTEHFNWDAVIDRWIGVYHACVAERIR